MDENKKAIKQVIVMRKDLNMRKGKMIAQGAHASMQFLIDRIETPISVDRIETPSVSDVEWQWVLNGMVKVCVYVNSEKELIKIHEKAKQANLTTFIIADIGRTEFHGVPTKTCLAIGPDYCEKIDPITKDLSLL